MTVLVAAQAQVPAHQQSFLAFDFGPKRTGVASGNRLLAQAQPRPTLKLEGQARFDAIARLLAEWQPDALVVGIPCHPDGTPHEMTQAASRFARQLDGRFGLPVYTVDERYTTTEAQSEGRADVRDADAGAACLILEQFLRVIA